MTTVDPQEQRLSVTLEATGEIVTSGIQQYRISSSFLIPTDAWSFTVYNDDDPASLRRKFRPLQPISLAINGQTQVLGRIDAIEGAGESGAALMVSGRDYLADIVDGCIDPTIQIKKEMDLGQALLAIFAPYGITTVFGDFNLTRNILSGVNAFRGKPAREFKKSNPDELRAGENEGAFEFAEKIVSRHGFTLQPAGTRDAIVCCVPHDLRDPSYRLARPGNVLRATASRDWSSVPTLTVARGRGGEAQSQIAGIKSQVGAIGDLLALDLSADARTDVSQQLTKAKEVLAATQEAARGRGSFATFDSDTVNPLAKIPEIQAIIRTDAGKLVVRETRFDPRKGDPATYGITPPVYRPLFYQDRFSKNQEQIEHGVRRMVAEKLKKTLEYSCTMRGHVDPKSGAIWSIDTVADVFDFIEQVDERLWLYERDLYNDGSGPMTSAKLIRPDSYIL